MSRISKKAHYQQFKGARISGKLQYTGFSQEETSAVIFVLGQNPGTKIPFKDFDQLDHLRKEGCCWLQISGLRNTRFFQQLAQYLEWSGDDTFDMLTAQHVSKVEVSDKTIFVIQHTIEKEQNGEIERGLFGFILADRLIVSFHDYADDHFHSLENLVLGGKLEVNKLSSGRFFTLLLRSVNEEYIEAIHELDDSLTSLEDSVLDSHMQTSVFLKQMRTIRNRQLFLQRHVVPLKEEYKKLVKEDHPLLCKEERTYYEDLNDQFTYIVQNTENCREMIRSLYDLHFSINDQNLNNIMKHLTMVSTIFIPLSFLAGIWGMNFVHMPELSFDYGYLIAWLIMLVVAFFSWWLMKRKRW